MQNQIYSYSFPLFQHAYNAYIGCYKNKQLLLAGPQPNGKSQINLFSYEDQNLKKSTGTSRQIESTITDLITAEQGQLQVAFLVGNKEGQSHLYSVKKDKIPNLEEEYYSTIYSQQESILSSVLKPDLSGIFLASDKTISLFDLEKGAIGTAFDHKAQAISNLTLDPNFQMLTYVSNQKQVVVCDKKTNNEKFTIKGKGVADILNIDYNPNKQYCLMTCHHQSIKFWDLRKGLIPFKTYQQHHSLLTTANYNHSHDQLIACGYDDGSVALLRLVSASSSMQGDAEDALVRLYDEHEDSVLRVEWARCSPWIFMSVACSPTLLVLNIVPNAEKYRILL